MGPRLFSRGDGRARQEGDTHGRASMGPRLFSRGDTTRRCRRTPWTACFNGATAFQPWRLHLTLVAKSQRAGQATAVRPWSTHSWWTRVGRRTGADTVSKWAPRRVTLRAIPVRTFWTWALGSPR